MIAYTECVSRLCMCFASYFVNDHCPILRVHTNTAKQYTPESTGSPWKHPLCWDYIKKYSRPIEFLYFYRPITIILSADWSDYIKDKTRRFPKSDLKLYNQPIVGRRSADTSADDKWWATIGRSSADDRPTVGRHIGRWYVAHSNMTSADLSADHRPILGRTSADHRPIAKTSKLSADGKKIITR